MKYQENSVINSHHAHQYKIINTLPFLYVWLIKKKFEYIKGFFKINLPSGIKV